MLSRYLHSVLYRSIRPSPCSPSLVDRGMGAWTARPESKKDEDQKGKKGGGVVLFSGSIGSFREDLLYTVHTYYYK